MEINGSGAQLAAAGKGKLRLSHPGGDGAQKNDGGTHFPHELIGNIAAAKVSVFTDTVSPSRATRQPKYLRISTEASTSDRRGQLCIWLSPSHKRVADSTGKALFFAP